MLIRKNGYPDIAPIAGQAHPEMKRAVLKSLLNKGALTAHMTFSSPLKLNKWDRPERLELATIHISNDQITGIDAEASIYPGTKNAPLHVALEDQDGDLHAVKDLSKRLAGKVSRGILTTDTQGKLWFCDATDAAQITGDEIIRPMKPITSPLMALCEGREDHPFSLTDQPMMGSFVRLREEVVCLNKDMITRSEMSDDQMAIFDKAMPRIEQQLDAINRRQSGIAALVDQYFTVEILSELVPDMSQDLTDGLVPAYSDFDRAKVYNAKIDEISMNFMNALRDAGYCAPCPNNGPREVGSMTAWNVWMDGGFEGEDVPFETQMLRHRLRESPAFDIIGGVIMRASIEIEDKLWSEHHPGEKKPYPNPDKGFIPASRIPEIFELAREALFECYAMEEDRILMMRSENLRSSDDGTTYVLAGSFLTPELALSPENYLDDPKPLPPLDSPAYIRQMDVPMPSGVLVMSDWFRIKGFKEGLLALGCQDDYDINTAKGLDDRAQDYFEKAGICIVQVGNCSPSAISQEDGIWRMGHFDEDHEDFWTEDGEPTTAQRPDVPWSTCTDLWANTFADRETVISVLMASDQYAGRSAAAEVLDTYIDESYGASATDLAINSLTLYAPTGAGIHKGNFTERFAASELTKQEWIEEMYVLSSRPLTVDPDLIEKDNWVSASFSVEDTTPEP